MLEGMFEDNFPTWLEAYTKKLDECKRMGVKMGNDEHYDAIIQLLAISVNENDTNVELVKEKELLPRITKIIQNSGPENDRYIPCLELIATLSNADSEIADHFILKNV